MHQKLKECKVDRYFNLILRLKNTKRQLTNAIESGKLEWSSGLRECHAHICQLLTDTEEKYKQWHSLRIVENLLERLPNESEQ